MSIQYVNILLSYYKNKLRQFVVYCFLSSQTIGNSKNVLLICFMAIYTCGDITIKINALNVLALKARVSDFSTYIHVNIPKIDKKRNTEAMRPLLEHYTEAMRPLLEHSLSIDFSQ